MYSLGAFANPKELECKKISSVCQVCNDTTKRSLDATKKELQVSDYACAVGDMHFDKKNKSFMSKDTCVNLSEFCSVCADQSFRYVKKEERHRPLQVISSDLYECATDPRTVRLTSP